MNTVEKMIWANFYSHAYHTSQSLPVTSHAGLSREEWEESAINFSVMTAATAVEDFRKAEEGIKRGYEEGTLLRLYQEALEDD